MVDHGANEGLAGPDMRGIHRTYRKIKIQDIDNHEVADLDVVTAATLLDTPQGNVTGIFNEYAYLWKGSSIHSSGQLEWLQTNVDETSVKVGGTQLITTLDEYSVPLLIKDGLAYATSLGISTDQDMDTYPHVFITSPDEWDPSQVPDQPFGDPMFDTHGDFNQPIIANLNNLLDAPPGDCESYTEISSVFTANLHQSSPQEPDWNTQRPFLAWASPSSIKDTFNVTTRHGTAPNTQDYIKHHLSIYKLKWVYNGILEVYLDMEAHISSATQITQKEPKETTKERGISLTIMGQRSIYNSTHKPQRSLNEILGFNHDDHLHRMCNETGIPEFLEFQIPGIPMVMMVTSRARSLHDPTQQDFINACTLPIYMCHM